MSQPLPMPSHLGQIEPPKDYFFDHRIPRLKDLLPKFQGIPGFTYAQVCVQNLRRAQDEGWREVGNTAIYSVQGPKGVANLKLLAKGSAIPGQSHASGRRKCLIDLDIENMTGLTIEPTELEAMIEVTNGEPPVLTSAQTAQTIEVEKTNETVDVKELPTDAEAANKAKT